MPRKDGFSTNQEMVADFNDAVYGAFVDAYERELQGMLPPAFEGKPIGTFTLDFVSRMISPVDGARQNESLTINVIAAESATFEDSISLRGTTQEVRDRYSEVAGRLSSLTLSDSLILADEVPIEGVNAEWILKTASSSKARHLSTHKERPQKASIASAKIFAELCREYVKSPFFDASFNLAGSDILGPNTTYADPVLALSHRFTVLHVTEVPLNGYESTEWLNEHANMLLSSAYNMTRHMEMFGDQLPSFLREIDTEKLQKINAALERTEAILANRR